MAQSADQMTSIVPFITSGVSFISGLLVAYFSGWVARNNRTKEKTAENIQNQLNEFYGPICALLAENTHIHQEFGPGRFQGKSAEIANSRGEIWSSLKESVIIPNLKSIRALIQSNWIRCDIAGKRHLQELMLHCIAFSEYDKAPNEMYERYKYKKTWIDDINKDISRLKGGPNE